LKRLDGRGFAAARAGQLESETDAAVRREWERA
jgi:hypothetical protein